jgi:hypothetical protein
MSEEIKSSIRSFQPQFQNKQQLTGKPEYYRVSLYSNHMSSGSEGDATFHFHSLFPNHRTDLLNGEWEVFVETFHANFQSQKNRYFGIQVCLPDLCRSSQNYIAVRGENFKTVCVVDDSVVTIPVSHEYATTTTIDIVQTAELEALPIRYNQRINVNDIGVKVDARTLLTGVIRIVLKDPFSNSPLFRTLLTDGTEEWFATLLFVHKP